MTRLGLEFRTKIGLFFVFVSCVLVSANAGSFQAQPLGLHASAAGSQRITTTPSPSLLRLRGGTDGKGVNVITSKEDFQHAVNTKEMAVCDFHASWCGPCHKISPYFEELSYNHTDVYFIKVDVDACQDIATACGITCMPTFVSYLNGKKHKEFSGADEGKLREVLSELRKAHKLARDRAEAAAEEAAGGQA